MRRHATLIAASLAVTLFAIFAVELLARTRPDAAVNTAESTFLWVAGATPAFPCGTDGRCGTDPDLAKLANVKRSFAFAPSSGTFRIVCIGDSTTAGWPYQPRGGYPEWLGEILRDVLPGGRVEVLNLGIHAWDGARLESVFTQALALRPEAVILRAGYNDYPNFLLRYPRGGALGRLRRDAVIFLLTHSAAYRRLTRGMVATNHRSFAVLAPGEEARLLDEHRARLTRLASSARSAGTVLIVLGLPSWSGFAPTYPGMRSLNDLAAANAGVARELGTHFVPLADLSRAGLFVDHVHSTSEGYRLTALAIARAMSSAGVPAPARAWRWDRLRPMSAQRRALGLEDPEYRMHLETALSIAYTGHGMREAAVEHMKAALLAATNPDAIPDELNHDSIGETAGVYREVFARLRREGRIVEPRGAANRKFTGLEPNPR
ncbi:MAG: GDSL-type esterase/lipase family protein [Elusimicrobiota bacterium]